MPLLRSGCTCSSFPLVSSSPSWINLQNTKRRPTNMHIHTHTTSTNQHKCNVCVCVCVIASHRRDLFFTLETILLAIFLQLFLTIYVYTYICMYLHVVSRKPKGNVKILSTCSGSFSLRKRCRLARHYMRTHTCTNISMHLQVCAHANFIFTYVYIQIY